MSADHPHGGQRVATFGARPEEAGAAVILLHGRGATAESILDLARHLGHPDLAYLAPQAASGTWYPRSFLAPLEDNQPHLGSALRVLGRLTEELEQRGAPPERTVVAGFSQGACLACEYVARHPRRRGGLAAFTGGILGPPDTPRHLARETSRIEAQEMAAKFRETAGEASRERWDMAGTPVFLGSSDPDPHVPWRRVEETAELFRKMAAEVTLRRYPGLPHTVNEEEIAWLAELLERLG